VVILLVKPLDFRRLLRVYDEMPMDRSLAPATSIIMTSTPIGNPVLGGIVIAGKK
jgi:hypothetical protein